MSIAVVTGCAGPAGRAVAATLLSEGYEVWGADANAAALADFTDSLAAGAHFRGTVVDLLDLDATREWAATIAPDGVGVDLVAHLVGGWRGGKSFIDNSLSDSDLLFNLLVRTLQTVSLSFHDALVRSPHGRFAIVSARAAAQPTPGAASYAAAKSAAETWTMALAASFARAQAEGAAPAAAIVVVKALLTDAMRAEQPDAPFSGYTHVTEVAQVIAGLPAREAVEINGSRIELGE